MLLRYFQQHKILFAISVEISGFVDPTTIVEKYSNHEYYSANVRRYCQNVLMQFNFAILQTAFMAALLNLPFSRTIDRITLVLSLL
jgi:hypothetical protein